MWHVLAGVWPETCFSSGEQPGNMARMPVRVQSVCVDSEDPLALASFWEAALGWRLTVEDDDEVALEPPPGSPENVVAPDLLFLRVPDRKMVKNRLHLDLRPDDQSAEVDRLQKLGARTVDIGQGPESTWVVMSDPEGNEFCVLRALSPDEAGSSAT